MSAKCGKLITTSLTFTTNQQVSWSDGSGGPLTATVTAADYGSPESVAAALQTAIRALAGGVGDGMTVAVSAGENGTGKTTITSGSGSASLTWTSTDIRDVLGFTAGFSGQTSATGSRHVKGLWLPDVVKYTKHGDSDNGRRVTDLMQTVTPDGSVKSMKGRYFDVHERIRWTGISGKRAKVHLEETVGESFERFWRDTQLGESSYFPVGTGVRFYWDADLSTYVTGKLVGQSTFDPARMRDGWTGRYVIELPTLVVQGA